MQRSSDENIYKSHHYRIAIARSCTGEPLCVMVGIYFMELSGIHFFNDHHGESRALISHVTEDHKLLIQLIRYSDVITATSICINMQQAEELEKLIRKFKTPF